MAADLIFVFCDAPHHDGRPVRVAEFVNGHTEPPRTWTNISMPGVPDQGPKDVAHQTPAIYEVACPECPQTLTMRADAICAALDEFADECRDAVSLADLRAVSSDGEAEAATIDPEPTP